MMQKCKRGTSTWLLYMYTYILTESQQSNNRFTCMYINTKNNEINGVYKHLTCINASPSDVRTQQPQSNLFPRKDGSKPRGIVWC